MFFNIHKSLKVPTSNIGKYKNINQGEMLGKNVVVVVLPALKNKHNKPTPIQTHCNCVSVLFIL